MSISRIADKKVFKNLFVNNIQAQTINSIELGGKQAFIPARLEKLDAAIENVVSPTGLNGAIMAFSLSSAGDQTHAKYAGKLSTASTTFDMNGDSIIRIASMGKFLGTVGFLKLVEDGEVHIDALLSTYIPAFTGTGVMEIYTPSVVTTLSGALMTFTSGGSNVNINQVGHPYTSTSLIGITELTQFSNTNTGLLATNVNGIYTANWVDVDNYTITLSGTSPAVNATAGNTFKVSTVDSTIKYSINGFYKVNPLTRPITIREVLNHSLGYAYGTYGYLKNIPLRNIQAEYYNTLNLPISIPTRATNDNYEGNVYQWATDLASVPLLFQPGTEWCYGPALSLLGAVIIKVKNGIELADTTASGSLFTYMNTNIFTPLGMNDTGFFLDSNSSKLSRVAVLYTGGLGQVSTNGLTNTTNTLAGSLSPPQRIETAWPPNAFRQDYFYKAENKKRLEFIDGGFISTPNDFMKFMKAILRDAKPHDGVNRLLSPGMISLLSMNHSLDNSINNVFDFGFKYQTVGKHPKWGLGVGILSGTTQMTPLPCLGSSHAIGWLGINTTNYAIDFANDFCYVAGTQQFFEESSKSFWFRVGVLNYSTLSYLNANREDGSSNNSASVSTVNHI